MYVCHSVCVCGVVCVCCMLGLWCVCVHFGGVWGCGVYVVCRSICGVFVG